MSNQQSKTAGQHVDSRQRPSPAIAARDRAIWRIDEARMLEDAGRNLLDIAGERLARGVRQQVERGAWLARTRLDDRAEPPHPSLSVLIGEAFGLGLNRLRHFAVGDRNDFPR